jgi:hypothetical protein
VCMSVRVSVCVCLSVRLYVSTVLNGSSPNLERTFYGSWHVSWAIYLFSAHIARACACVLNARTCVHSLIFEWILSKFAGDILRLTISDKDYVLFMFTHNAHVIKHSLIYGRILFKFVVNILPITTSSMGYLLFMFTHRTHACMRACSSARA